MKTNKPRNRESRTKPIPTESSVAIRLRLPRESYDQMRDQQAGNQGRHLPAWPPGLLQSVIHPYAFPPQRVAGIHLMR